VTGKRDENPPKVKKNAYLNWTVQSKQMKKERESLGV